jgi:hypothetical protein
VYLVFLPLYPIAASLMGEATSNTVIAVATAVNVGVTLLYAIFTWLLWRETRAAARTAAEQIRLTRVEQGLRLRPYVSITPEILHRPGGPNPFTFRFALANKGPVPAHIRRLAGWVWIDGRQQPGADGAGGPSIEQHRVIFPESRIGTDWERVADTTARIAVGQTTVRARIRVEYAGTHDPAVVADAPTYVSDMSFRYEPRAQDFFVEEPTIAT